MDRHTQSRLKKERVIWLVTDGRDGSPQAVPVWFLWDGTSFLIFAQPGVKVRQIQQNPNVELHLNSDDAGDDVVRASGRAAIPKSHPRADKHPGYLRKYRGDIRGIGMSVQDFADRYHYPIVVRRPRFH